MDPAVVAASGESAPPIPDPVPAPSGPLPELSSLTAAERQAWRLTGQLPTKEAASSAATTPETESASTDATPEAASEPAPGPEVTYKARTEKRFTELLESNRALQQQIAKLQAKPDVAASSSVPAESDDPEPDPSAYEDFAKYVRDAGLWAARKVAREEHATRVTAAAKAATQAETTQMQQAWNDRVQAATTAYPDFDRAAVEAAIPAKSIVDAFVLEATPAAAAALLYHFQKTPTDLPRVLNLPPMAQLEELVMLKQKVTAAPVVKRTTTAPDPAPTLGTRATPADRLTSALKSGDQRAYREEANRRDLAARKGL